jgi:hypothetical protein
MWTHFKLGRFRLMSYPYSINDCEEILNLVVDTPSKFALHAQRFQEVSDHFFQRFLN